MESMIEDLCHAGLSGKFGEFVKDKSWIKIWVRDDFRCVYCNTFLLGDLVHMVSAQIDHLLPQWKYKSLVNEELNHVLACYCCNQLKREFDPLDEVRKHEGSILDANDALLNNREKLIITCKEYLAQGLTQKKSILNSSIDVLKRYNRDIP